MKKTVTSIAAALVVAGAAASYGSPYWTMHELRSAMIEKDADSFSSRVDFPSLRESLRAQFMQVMQVKLGSSPDLKGNPFAGLGMMMAMGVVNQMIDTMVTPAGVMTMMAQGTAKPARQGETQPAIDNSGDAPKVDYSVGYRDWSTVTATAHKGTDDEVTFVLKRDGLWLWKLTGVNLPVDKIAGN